MLDLYYVRENLEAVRTALNNRNFPTELLDKFADLDLERRRVIGESDKINQLRNLSSNEIGALMQSGKRDEAEAKKVEVAGLKDKQTELEKQRKEFEAKMHDLLANLPNIPHESCPIGKDETANVEIRKWGELRKRLILKSKTTLIWAKIWAF